MTTGVEILTVRLTDSTESLGTRRSILSGDNSVSARSCRNDLRLTLLLDARNRTSAGDQGPIGATGCLYAQGSAVARSVDRSDYRRGKSVRCVTRQWGGEDERRGGSGDWGTIALYSVYRARHTERLGWRGAAERKIITDVRRGSQLPGNG